MSNLISPVEVCSDLKSCDYDGVVVVAPSVGLVPFEEVKAPLEAVTAVDAAAEKGVFLAVAPQLPGKRVVFSSTGPLDKDYDDVRRYFLRHCFSVHYHFSSITVMAWLD